MAGLDPSSAEADEIRSLLQAVYERYGFDFRDYAPESMSRRIWNVVRSERSAGIADLARRLVAEPACMERFLSAVTVNVTTMFRDPGFYLALRTHVIPVLRAWPFVRIWHAGCSSGEEVYSMAILLDEEGLYPRCRIYATDMNEHVLDRARAGIFPLSRTSEYEANYSAAGGKGSLRRHYTARYDHLIFRRALKENIVFSRHDLVADRPFNEFHLILCRNVMIYFNRRLCDRVHRLLYDSLSPLGFLGLGSRETTRFTPYAGCYEDVDGPQRIYRKVR